MKKSISTWSFYGNWNLEQKLQLAKDAGFKGFEIDLTEDGPVNLQSSEGNLSAVRKLADKIGIQFSGLATGLYWEANGASENPTTRAKAGHILKRQTECAHGLGLDAILLVPAAVGVDFIPGCEVIAYDVAYDYAKGLVQNALPLAEKLGVTICIENVWNKFLLSPIEMRSFIDEFENPQVGAYFDVGNVLSTGYPEQWIRILETRIKRVHFKDYRRAVGTTDGFVDLLAGDVNWPAVIAALTEIQYSGWVAAEMIPPIPFYKHCPEVLIHTTSLAMDAILKLTPV